MDSQVDLCITKDDYKIVAVPGTEDVYTITITNHGSGVIHDLHLSDVNPKLFKLTFENPSEGHFDNYTGEWAGLNLGHDDTITIEVTGIIDPKAHGELTNMVDISVPCNVDNTGENSASDTDKLVQIVDLCVTKDDGKCEVIPGTENVYKITITNNGPSEITSVQLTDINPLLKDIKFENPSKGYFDNFTGEWKGINLGHGDTICIDVRAFIEADAPCGELTNVVRVTVPECVINLGDNKASDTDKLVPTVDLCVTKDDGKCESVPGTENIYNITITNNGPSEISSLHLEDTNPLLFGLTFQNPSEGHFDNYTGEWTGLTLGCGETICIEVKGTVDPNAGCGELTNVVKVTVPECVVNKGDDKACDTDTLVPVVDLCVTKDDGKCTAIPGTENVYTITITNNGPSQIDSLRLIDVNPLLKDITFQNESKGYFDKFTSEWKGLDLGHGDTVTIEVKGYIEADAGCGELTNVIKVQVPECYVNLGDNKASDTDKLVPTVDLCVTKDDGKCTAIPGTENVYTITITNNGPSEINSLQLTDCNPILQDICFQNASQGCFDAATGQWTDLCLGNGDTVTIEVKGYIPADAECGELTNVINVCVPECVVNTGQDSACDTDKLVPTVDLCVTKDDGKCEVIPGTENTYTITITNNGPSEINSLQLFDCNPILQDICFQNASQGCFDQATGQWTGLSLGCGDTVCIEVKGYIPADAECGELTNVINVCVPECVVNTGDSSACDTDKLVPTVDLCITKDDGKSEAIPGTDNVYLITITNNGPSEISSLYLSDENALLQNIYFQCASEGYFDECTGEWSGLTLGCGDTITIEVVGTVDPAAGCGELTNVITVCVPECVVNTGQSSACDTDQLVPTVDLCVTKDDGKCTAIPGTENVYTITITNNGPSEINSLQLTDCNPILQDICFQNASQGCFDAATGQWTDLCLGNGDTVIIEVKGYIPADAECGELTNVINVSVPECVVNTGDSSACDTDKLVPTVDLCVTKDDGKCEVTPGTENVYTITITNNGPSEINSLQLFDCNPILQDICFQNASQGCFDAATGQWTGLCLGNGDTVCIEVKGYIPADTECGELTNVINVCVPECVVNTGENSACDTDKIVKPDCDNDQGNQCGNGLGSQNGCDDNNGQDNQCGQGGNNGLGSQYGSDDNKDNDNQGNSNCEPLTSIFPNENGDSNGECFSLIGQQGDGIWRGNNSNFDQGDESQIVLLGPAQSQGSLNLNEVIDNSANGSDGDKCKTNLTTLLDNICQPDNKSSNNCPPLGNSNVSNDNQPNGEGESSASGQPNGSFTPSTNNDLRSFEFSATNASNSTSSGD